MTRTLAVAQAIADALLAGAPGIDEFRDRCAWVLGRKHRWIKPLCRRIFHRFGSSLDHRDRGRLIAAIRDDAAFQHAWNAARPPRIAHYFLDPPRMSPRQGALAACKLPSLPTPGDLAAWLGVAAGELDWLADGRGINPAGGKLCHYRYAWIPKRYGMRLMEIPKPRLREIQRKILREILEPVPVHAAAHGFRKGRSCRSFVDPHVGRAVLLRIDLRNFFPGIPAPRVHALFAMLGYPEAVARLLTALCTNAVPASVARVGGIGWHDVKRLAVPHLPQGAPTSPALANLCALHLDMRLSGLSEELDANYTRYADDLALSGGETLRRRVDAVRDLVTAIAGEEGFEINARKTRVMHRSDRQVLTGIIVNDKPNIGRREYDRLKAILTNCERHGPASQNRQNVVDFRAHLAGRVAYVRSLNATRGEKLEGILRRIRW